MFIANYAAKILKPPQSDIAISAELSSLFAKKIFRRVCKMFVNTVY